jgi:hypothetical protein
MKGILGTLSIAAAVAIGAIWGLPAVTLSERGITAYLDELEGFSLEGDAPSYCARLHADLQVVVWDATASTGATRIEGGKREWCDYVSYSAKGIELLGLETQVTRNAFTVHRRWVAPWRAEVSYAETRTSTMRLLGKTVNTVSDDRWTLVQTLTGVKVLRLESSARLAQPVPPTVSPSTRSVG